MFTRLLIASIPAFCINFILFMFYAMSSAGNQSMVSALWLLLGAASLAISADVWSDLGGKE